MNTIAEVSHLDSEQYDAYLKSILEYNEAKAALDTAFDEGKAEGQMIEKFETARAMLAEGFDVATVARITKLTEEEIKNAQK